MSFSIEPGKEHTHAQTHISNNKYKYFNSYWLSQLINCVIIRAGETFNQITNQQFPGDLKDSLHLEVPKVIRTMGTREKFYMQCM